MNSRPTVVNDIGPLLPRHRPGPISEASAKSLFPKWRIGLQIFLLCMISVALAAGCQKQYTLVEKVRGLQQSGSASFTFDIQNAIQVYDSVEICEAERRKLEAARKDTKYSYICV